MQRVDVSNSNKTCVRTVSVSYAWQPGRAFAGRLADQVSKSQGTAKAAKQMRLLDKVKSGGKRARDVGSSRRTSLAALKTTSAQKQMIG